MNFFEKKIFKLIGFEDESNEISDKNLLDLHLSHRVVKNFEYVPSDETTPKMFGNIYHHQIYLKKLKI